MYKFFKTIAESSSCTLKGACTIHPSVSALSLVLQEEIKEIAYYLVKLKELNFSNQEINDFCISALSIFLINTSFNKKKYLNLVKELNLIKIQAKEKYISHCKEKNIPCEMINNEFELKDNNLQISQLIKHAEFLNINKQKNCEKQRLRLFELIALFAKLCAIVSKQIKKENGETNELNYEILRFLALSNSFSIRQEKLKRRILEFCEIFEKALKKLDSLKEKNYGEKTSAKVNLYQQKGHSILISGDDLSELKKLLDDIEASKKENINVYTHGAMFYAHFFPSFQNNPYLKGHLGTNTAEYDFSNFQGAILLTQNFVQKIDSLYRGDIFSNKIISFDKVLDIKNNDYLPLVEMAEKIKEFDEKTIEKTKEVSYDKIKIINFLKTFSQDEIIIVVGNIENSEFFMEYKNKKVLNLNCPCDSEIIFEIIEILRNKQVKISLFFAQCNVMNLKIIFALLNKNLKVYTTNCPHVLINPHVVEALIEDFKLKII